MLCEHIIGAIVIILVVAIVGQYHQKYVQSEDGASADLRAVVPNSSIDEEIGITARLGRHL